jgi:hypothetical protein
MTGVELVLFASLIGWLITPEPAPYPCYKQIDNAFIPYICEDQNNGNNK